ncbi:hypothetical protein RND71_009558 [Anisodus tanguticus]|uniref:Uncharacterized protein n=1 Tax=Anisodus tanguticus TaxID=243964 RepID=A0AAE1SIN1_9SOLA|nr:hypothetical protein RND71_009558 [Anisodus tanguticus]
MGLIDHPLTRSRRQGINTIDKHHMGRNICLEMVVERKVARTTNNLQNLEEEAELQDNEGRKQNWKRMARQIGGSDGLNNGKEINVFNENSDEAFEMWRYGKGMEFMHDSLDDTISSCKLMKCRQIALLCDQKDPLDGPTMLEVSNMLKNIANLSVDFPKRPAFLAFEMWRYGKSMEFMDDSIDDTISSCNLLKCMQIALLCGQKDPLDGPTMLEVSNMLKNIANLSIDFPKRPAFSV